MDIGTFIKQEKEISCFLPKTIEKNLKHRISVFLMLYPMPTKRIKIYRGLKENQQLGFLMKYMLGQAYKAKIDKGFLQLYIETKEKLYFIKKHLKHLKHEELDTEMDIKNLINKLSYEQRITEQTVFLTKITKHILDILINKNSFLFVNTSSKRYL